MKQILIIFGFLLVTVSTFAQSPRIKLNQITKDTVKGSVLVSSPSDSGMVYSRDFYIAYGADTVLILYGDTLAATSGIISSVLSDGVTITGNGTSGNELKVDTSFIATLTALNDSLATLSASTTPDGVTITGDGSGGNPLKVDTLLIATIKALNDTLTARNYLAVSQLTDTLNANTRGFLTAEVDGSISNEGSLTVEAGTASTSVISSNTSGSTDVTLEAGTNVTLSENTGTNTITIASTGGGTSFNNISEDGDTVLISDHLKVDTTTLYVDATTNRVGIGTSSPGKNLDINGSIRATRSGTFPAEFVQSTTATTGLRGAIVGNAISTGDMTDGFGPAITFQAQDNTSGLEVLSYFGGFRDGSDFKGGLSFWTATGQYLYSERLTIKSNGNVGIGTTSPSSILEINQNVNSSSTVTLKNINTGTSARIGHIFWNGTGAGDYFAFLLNGDNYNGISGWNDRFTVQSGTGVTNGLLFYSDLGGIQLSANGTNTKDIYVEDITGNVFMENLQSTLVGNYDLRIASTGEIGYNTSSVRFKENINDYNKGLEYVLNLRPVTFNYIADTLNRQMVGFIAEQLDEIGLQEGVVYKEDGSVEGINSRIYNPILVNAIKEQQAIIETQQQTITDLQNTIQSLITRIENLENQ